MKFRCLYCGCEREFVEIKLADVLILRDFGNYSQSVKSYACTECGFVQLFDKEQAQKRLSEIKNDELFIQKLNEYKKEVKDLETEIKKLELIINDENQTVKTVNSAKEQVLILKRKLEELNRNQPKK